MADSPATAAWAGGPTFNLSSAAAKAARSNRWSRRFGIGLFAFFAALTVLYGVFLLEPPHAGIFCDQGECAPVPASQYYATWGPVTAACAAGTFALGWLVLSAYLRPRSLAVATEGLRLEYASGRRVLRRWPQGREWLELQDFRSLNAAGRKYFGTDGRVYPLGGSWTIDLPGPAVDGILEAARTRGLYVSSRSEESGDLTRPFGTLTKYRIGTEPPPPTWF